MNNNLSNLKTTWQDIKKIATEIKILNNIKLAKFNQLISYTSELLNSCDMTLLPTSTDNAMSNCKEIIANLKNDYNDDSINNALKALDNVIVCISPYVVNDSTAKAASIGINEYHSIVENYIKIMEEKKKEIDSLDLEGKKASIDQINVYHAKLFTNDNNSIQTQIELAQQTCNSFNSEYNSIKPQMEEIQKYKSEIFEENGIKQEINNIVNKGEENQKECENLIKTLNELLPGAISAGLASAYNELKVSNEKEVKWYNIMFFISLLLLAFAAIMCFINPYRILEPLDTTDLIKWGQLLIQRALLVSPLLWFTLFSSKRRSEFMRLQQEYAHKEAVTKSYVSFNKQIDDIKTNTVDHTSLTNKLLETAISAIAFNASSTLDKKHGDKLLTQELGERIKDNIGN